jgi:hypothetical protein
MNALRFFTGYNTSEGIRGIFTERKTANISNMIKFRGPIDARYAKSRILIVVT